MVWLIDREIQNFILQFCSQFMLLNIFNFEVFINFFVNTNWTFETALALVITIIRSDRRLSPSHAGRLLRNCLV